MKKSEYIIVNELSNSYKYYAGFGKFTTLVRLAIVKTSYKKCEEICNFFNKDNYNNLVIKDANIIFRKEKLEKLNEKR